jgi:PIN domain nuclease of toxin-antitoxin system
MKLLLDTCTFLWMISTVDQLSPVARSALEDSKNRLSLHQISSLEIQIKYQLGKLKLADSPEKIVQEGLHLHGIHYQPLSDTEIWHLQHLPSHHRDPFDRILITSALITGWQIVTPDPQIKKYPVRTLW